MHLFQFIILQLGIFGFLGGEELADSERGSGGFGHTGRWVARTKPVALQAYSHKISEPAYNKVRIF